MITTTPFKISPADDAWLRCPNNRLGKIKIKGTLVNSIDKCNAQIKGTSPCFKKATLLIVTLACFSGRLQCSREESE